LSEGEFLALPPPGIWWTQAVEAARHEFDSQAAAEFKVMAEDSNAGADAKTQTVSACAHYGGVVCVPDQMTDVKGVHQYSAAMCFDSDMAAASGSDLPFIVIRGLSHFDGFAERTAASAAVDNAALFLRTLLRRLPRTSSVRPGRLPMFLKSTDQRRAVGALQEFARAGPAQSCASTRI
jgi:hypothetical protein